VDTFFLPHDRMARPKPGGVAFISQSGAFAGAISDAAAMSNIGLEKVISHGNKVDVNEADLLDYLREDPNIKVIAIYLEGLEPGEGPRFMEALRRTSLEKPVIIVKAGKTARGTAIIGLVSLSISLETKGLSPIGISTEINPGLYLKYAKNSKTINIISRANNSTLIIS